MGTRKPSDLSLAVFDLDGTLVELEIEHFIDHAVETTRSLGFPVPTRERIRQLMHSHTIEELFPPEAREEAVHKYWHSYDAREIPAPRLIEGALATLEEMVARGFDLAIATARTVQAEELREILRPTGITNHVEFLSTWWNTGWTEKREQLFGLCREHRIDPSKAMMVGDSLDDMRSSSSCGFGLRIGLLHGIHSHEVLMSAQPDYVVDSVTKVPPILDLHLSE
ncbi:MAG: hypothetical protein RL518_1455 [Pseudomonadota bacterium]|jgi:phosphoglycolate phosphatase-like HAD superfamily hydrolase